MKFYDLKGQEKIQFCPVCKKNTNEFISNNVNNEEHLHCEKCKTVLIVRLRK